MARVQYTLMACTDCLQYVANGEVAEGGQWSPEAVSEVMGGDERWLCCGDSEIDDEFSWSPCECCGSHLGGSRHELAVVR